MPSNRILEKMLDRLYASLISGPSLNCRPHSSRQRVDLTALSAMGDTQPADVMASLLAGDNACAIRAAIAMPKVVARSGKPMHFADDDTSPPPTATDAESNLNSAPDQPDPPKLSPEDRQAVDAWRDQKSLLTKLRNLSEESRTYEQDTGVPALFLGYPLLSMPPDSIAGSTRRVLAPIAFIPLSLSVAAGRSPGIQLAARGEGVDLVTPNPALMAWLEREAGASSDDLFDEDDGANPWQEIRELIAHVAAALSIADVDPETMAGGERIPLIATPRADDLPAGAAIIPAAVLGLFPASNQGLLRDTRALIAAPDVPPTVAPFVDPSASLDYVEHAMPDDQQPLTESKRMIADERFVTLADPFQARAVTQARTSRGVVIHGPPGTGKSQTITNIIADHLARGQRVLFVCDKRTALDVVSHRLDHLGLGRLCALVHDPQRDQRHLYMKIRASLDDLPDIKTHPRAANSLEKLDKEMVSIHVELTACHGRLMTAAGDELSFHELVGAWLAIEAPTIDDLDETTLRQTPLTTFDQHREDVQVMVDRAGAIDFAVNPWSDCAGSTLDAFLARSMDSLRQSLASCVEDARVADNTRHEHIPPFDATEPLADQAAARVALASLVSQFGKLDQAVRRLVADISPEALVAAAAVLRDVQPHRASLDRPVDSELSLAMQGQSAVLRQLNQDIAALTRYVDVAGSWKRLFAFKVKGAARKLLAPFGLNLSIEDASRLRAFFESMRARLLLTHAVSQLRPNTFEDDILDDHTLVSQLTAFDVSVAAMTNAGDLAPQVALALVHEREAEKLHDGLARSGPRAAALEALEQSMHASALFDDHWLAGAFKQLREGKQAGETLARLQGKFDTYEEVIRVREAAAGLPASMVEGMRVALRADVTPTEAAGALRREVLAGEVRRRLDADPELQRFDAQKVEHQFARYRQLEEKKRELVRDAIVHYWIDRQRTKLLSGTRSRLNTAGADLRRRLFVRGKRAMRLRQMIAVGERLARGERLPQDDVEADDVETNSAHDGVEGSSSIAGNTDTASNAAPDANASSNAWPQPNVEADAVDPSQGDPLFDMCPVWMASPETVAQVFSRREMFDVVIFDEASQCRLEEALPVLIRAKRVVIAGDPKQLPPTRFFEAAITVSDDDELETEQDLFEAQQGEVEDLLTAALNLQVDEAFLDVHYRSQNADLIEFSNTHFYKSRLQAIPGHPKNQRRFPPLSIHRADGRYEDRCNRTEALRVVQLVDDLLSQKNPPSIGIACFNIRQRDLIIDLLDDKAVDDDDFATRLATSRARVGEGSFEGLFVKNLENVQGDERDHIIISTTYGPTTEGRFFRRFGPLGRAGGGRRLNVLVTRARAEIHLVTSIPRDAYLSVEALPTGATPSGAWLLFAYLRYAEQLATVYEDAFAQRETLDQGVGVQHVRMEIPPTSAFAVALGRRLAAERSLGSHTHWGNEGFCIDAAIHHPTNADDVTVGLLCDFTRYDRAPDPIEWEIYRQGIFDWTGWDVHRVWTPQFFRDATRTFNEVIAASDDVATKASR